MSADPESACVSDYFFSTGLAVNEPSPRQP
jgi:hypothetical protein